MKLHMSVLHYDAIRPSAHACLASSWRRCVTGPGATRRTGRSRSRRVSTTSRGSRPSGSSPRATQVEQTRPTAAPGASRHAGRSDARGGDDAGARAQPGAGRRAPESADLRPARSRGSARPISPTATSQFNQRAVVQPPTNQLNGGNIVQNDTTDYNAGIVQALPWGGGDVAFQFNNRKQVTSNIFANFNPTYTSNFNLTFTQPLLRGFLIDDNRQQLRVTAINRDISEIQLRGTIATTLADVRNAYWELLYAIEAVEVARGSLTLAEKLVEDNQTRVEIGTMAPLDVVQAQAEAATRRQAVAQAEATWRTAELSLKRLIVNGTDDPLWRASINPADRPVFAPEAARRRRRRARGAAEPDGSGTGAASDPGERHDHARSCGTRRFRTSTSSPATARRASAARSSSVRAAGSAARSSGTVPGGYSDALRTLTGARLPHLELPAERVRIRSAPAPRTPTTRAHAFSSTSRRHSCERSSCRWPPKSPTPLCRSRAASRDTRQRRSRGSWRETRLEAEQSRFEVGLSTNFFVVQAQRDLATAQNSELRALLDYRRALVDFERVAGSAGARGGGITTLNAAAEGAARQCRRRRRRL